MKLKVIHIILDVLILVAVLLNIYMSMFIYMLFYDREEVPEIQYTVNDEVTPNAEVEENTQVIVEELPPENLEIIQEYIPPREDVEAIARTMYGECRGIPSDMEKAAVAWCILNRLDAGNFGDTILEVVSAPNQFTGYNSSNPILDELVFLAEDVMIRWHAEKSGVKDVGRVLPEDYLWFSGDYHKNPGDAHNYFRNKYRNYDESNIWGWSFEDVYS